MTQKYIIGTEFVFCPAQIVFIRTEPKSLSPGYVKVFPPRKHPFSGSFYIDGQWRIVLLEHIEEISCEQYVDWYRCRIRNVFTNYEIDGFIAQRDVDGSVHSL